LPAKHSILLLAGEASGDYHAAAMVRRLKELDPTIEISGIGGDELACAGMKLLFHYRDVNTIGLSEGLGKLRSIINAYKRMKSELSSRKHHLFIPVDFPDVNLMLCRIAKTHAVPVCYFISPQVWAWRKGRIKKIAKRVDRMMTIFPFEAKMYKNAGMDAEFVGHTMVRDIPPVVDRYALRKQLGLSPDKPVIALVPGSRPAEVSRILPIMAQASQICAQSFPETQFVLPVAGDHLKDLVSAILADFDMNILTVRQEAAKCMGAGDAGIITSGTATLQAALVGLPHVVVYRLDPLSWFIARRILKPLVMAEDIHVAMANVLALKAGEQGGPLKILENAGVNVKCLDCGRRLLVPELLQSKASPEVLANWLMRLTTDAQLAGAMKKGFWELRRMLTPADENIHPAAVVMECLSYAGRENEGISNVPREA